MKRQQFLNMLFLLANMMCMQNVMAQGYNYDKYYFDDNSGFTFSMIRGEAWVTGVKEGVNLQGLQIPAKVIYVHEDYPAMQQVGYEDTYVPEIKRYEYDVVGVGSSVFRGHEELTSVTLPANIKYIGAGIFSDCTNLKELVINGPLTELPGNILLNCSSLKSFKVPSTVTKISYRTFYNATGLESIVLPEGITEIPQEAFYGCVNLKSAFLPSSVTAIRERSFQGCSSLESMVIPSAVTEIETCAFINCSSMRSVELPPTITTIKNSVFMGCSSLASITFPEALTTIENGAFYNCGLTSLVIPSTIESIDDQVFYGCNRLRKVIIEDRDTPLLFGWGSKYSGQFGTSPLNYVYIGGDIILTHKQKPTNSGYFPFRKNTYLRTLIIGECVKEIPNYAFEGCTNLQRLDLSSSIISIGNYAFSCCPRLKAVTVKWKEPLEGDDGMFYVRYDYYGDGLGIVKEDHTYNNATLYIKGVSTYPYKSVSPWKLFKNQEYLGIHEEPNFKYDVQGDLNDDGDIDVTDVVELIDMVLAGSNDPAGDINGDGEVDVTDVVELIDIVLGN